MFEKLYGESAAQAEGVGQGGEGAVVIAAAIAEPVAGRVERQQRHQQKIRTHDFARGVHRAEPARRQRVARAPGAKDQRQAEPGLFRQAQGVPSRRQGVEQRPDVDLVGHRPEPGDDGFRRGRQSRSTCSARRAPASAGLHEARRAIASARCATLAAAVSIRPACLALEWARAVSAPQAQRKQKFLRLLFSKSGFFLPSKTIKGSSA